MSIAAMSVRWLWRKLRQVGEGLWAGMYLPTVAWLTSMPFEQSTVVRAAVSSHIASSGMKRRSSQKSSGEPSAGNLHAGFCLGDEFKKPRSLGEGTVAKASD